MRIISDEEVTLIREINTLISSGAEVPADQQAAFLDRIKAVYMPDGTAIVKTENLERWADKLKEANQFRADAETDIGYVAESVYNLQNIGDPMKLVMKMISGRGIDVKALGLDIDRLAQITEKFAPKKFAELKRKQEELKSKK